MCFTYCRSSYLVAAANTVCSEHPMVSAKASVMVYSDTEKKWLPSGSSSGISKVCIYHHPGNNTFRVVGRKLQDMEVSWGMCSFPACLVTQAMSSGKGNVLFCCLSIC